MVLRYLPLARAEYLDQVEYYERRAPGLGRRFMQAVQEAECLVLNNPHGYSCVEPLSGLRAVVLKRFPFRLLYRARAEEVLVAAVAHTAREPAQFLQRD
ncbi:type II toxin-antitoxin system RelE/ParE family toxin [Caldimonas brevitalea]|uniref:Plasmid stabilization system n=1 Tax=Caldimonas brevitalea TaxID=413882 RepID=A0A0G3BGL5_9BURK|nr:type II toxin-antitoxin system RelE/ParE family toxin [Caldimonas brevitalea]AKJ28462.1 plasmid stabilization system [Caldimonas brevitalea]